MFWDHRNLENVWARYRLDTNRWVQREHPKLRYILTVNTCYWKMLNARGSGLQPPFFIKHPTGMLYCSCIPNHGCFLVASIPICHHCWDSTPKFQISGRYVFKLTTISLEDQKTVAQPVTHAICQWHPAMSGNGTPATGTYWGPVAQ